MIKVGLVGEDPNDTSSIKNLLEKKYEKSVYFIPLGKGIKGDQMDTIKLKNLLVIEFETKELELAILIRDLDALKTDVRKLTERIKWFENLNKSIRNKGLLLLNITKLEALIFADVQTFNKMYGTKCKSRQNPMFIADPKQKLKELTFHSKKQYKESHCPEIFKQLDVEKVENNCAYFKEFIAEFDSKI